MKRTGAVDLIVPFLVIGVTVFVLLKVSYDSLPPLGYLVPAPLAALAVVEFVVARRVRLNSQLVTKTHALVRPGDVITLTQPTRIRVLRVLALGLRRGPATEAQTLYEELGDLA